MAVDKPHMNLAVIGHIDHGKSTTVGRLLFETGTVPPHIIESYRKEAESKGKGSFEFAWVMDSLKEERERGITIDIAHKRFDTDKYYFTVVDCPGHRDFVKNMITGASQADAALLVVAAPDGVMEQTKEHVFLARTLGINQLIIGINKMDVVKYDEKRYNEVKEQLSQLIKMVGYKPDAINFIPMSSFVGDNIGKRSANTSWYKGPTVLEALNMLVEPEKPTNLPMRLPIQDVYSISGIGTVPVGRVETGIMKKGRRSASCPRTKRVRSSPSRCTTKRSRRRSRATTSGSTFVASARGTSAAATSAVLPTYRRPLRMSSPRRSSCSTTPAP